MVPEPHRLYMCMYVKNGNLLVFLFFLLVQAGLLREQNKTGD